MKGGDAGEGRYRNGVIVTALQGKVMYPEDHTLDKEITA
jgi:hypothetical protein